MMKSNFNKIIGYTLRHWYIWLILFAGFVPLLFFRKGLLIAGADEICFLNPAILFDYRKFILDAKTNFGNPVLDTDLFPFLSFWHFFTNLKLSLIIIEKIWLILSWLPAGFSMVYLIRILQTEKKESSFWIFSAALLYLLNPFTMLKPIQYNFRLVYIVFPLILGLFIKGMEHCDDKKSNFYAILIGLASLAFATSSANLPTVAPLWLVLILYFFFFVLNHKDKSNKALIFLFKVFALNIFLNLWCYNIIFQQILSFAMSAPSATKAWNAISSASVLDAFRLMGYWAFRSGYGYMNQDFLYYPYHSLYYGSSFWISFSTFLVPSLSFLIFMNKKIDKKIYFFGMLALIGIFLTKGSNPPFGTIYKWIHQNIPGVWVFREPWAKFTPITLLSYSVLFGYSIQSIVNYLRKGRNILFKRFGSFLLTISIVLVCILISFPVFTGKAIWDINQGQMRTMYVKVPQYWEDVSSWLKERWDNRRVYLLPREGYGVALKWEHGISGGRSPAWILLPNNIIRFNDRWSASEDKFIDLSYKSVDNRLQFINLLRMMNAGYILHQKDLMYAPVKSEYSSEDLSKILQNSPYLELVKKDGELELYAVKEQYYLDRVYIPEDVCFYTGEIKNQIFDGNILNSIKRIMFVDKSGFNSEGYTGNSTAKIKEVKIINPTHIEIKLKHSYDPFWIVLSNNYSKDWKLFLGENKPEKIEKREDYLKFKPDDIKFLFRKPLEAQHCFVNGFANGWYIDPKLLKSDKDTTIVLYFLPQSVFYLSLAISLLAFFICIIYLTFYLIKRR